MNIRSSHIHSLWAVLDLGNLGPRHPTARVVLRTELGKDGDGRIDALGRLGQDGAASRGAGIVGAARGVARQDALGRCEICGGGRGCGASDC